MKINNYRDLIVWQKAMDLCEMLYKATVSFPKEEVYGITAQMRRCAVSIASNIAEGHSRNTKGEYIQFIGISKGSLSELETQIILANRLGYCKAAEKENLLSLCSEVGKMLVSIQIKLKSN
jgi:four helix bundle protein